MVSSPVPGPIAYSPDMTMAQIPIPHAAPPDGALKVHAQDPNTGRMYTGMDTQNPPLGLELLDPGFLNTEQPDAAFNQFDFVGQEQAKMHVNNFNTDIVDAPSGAQPVVTPTKTVPSNSGVHSPGVHSPAPGSPAQRGGDGTPKKRKRFTQQQLESLEKSFAVTKNPSVSMREDLARSLDMTPGQVKIWFQNRRQKEKRNRLEIVKELGIIPNSPGSPQSYSAPGSPVGASPVGSPTMAARVCLEKLAINSPTPGSPFSTSPVPGSPTGNPLNTQGLNSPSTASFPGAQNPPPALDIRSPVGSPPMQGFAGEPRSPSMNAIADRGEGMPSPRKKQQLGRSLKNPTSPRSPLAQGSSGPGAHVSSPLHTFSPSPLSAPPVSASQLEEEPCSPSSSSHNNTSAISTLGLGDMTMEGVVESHSATNSESAPDAMMVEEVRSKSRKEKKDKSSKSASASASTPSSERKEKKKSARTISQAQVLQRSMEWVSRVCRMAWSALHVDFYRQGDHKYDSRVAECAMVLISQLRRIEIAYGLQPTELEDIALNDEESCRLQMYFGEQELDIADTQLVERNPDLSYMSFLNTAGMYGTHLIFDVLESLTSVFLSEWSFDGGDPFHHDGNAVLKKIFKMYENAFVVCSSTMTEDELTKRVLKALELDQQGTLQFGAAVMGNGLARAALSHRRKQFFNNPTIETYRRAKKLCENTNELSQLRGDCMKYLQKRSLQHMETIARILIEDQQYQEAFNFVSELPSNPVVRYVCYHVCGKIDADPVLRRAREEITRTISSWCHLLYCRLFPDGEFSQEEYDRDTKSYVRQMVSDFSNPISAMSPTLRSANSLVASAATDEDSPEFNTRNDFCSDPTSYFRGICGWLEVGMVASWFASGRDAPAGSEDGVIGAIRPVADATVEEYVEFASCLQLEVLDSIRAVDASESGMRGAFESFLGEIDGNSEALNSLRAGGEYGGLLRLCHSCWAGSLMEFTQRNFSGSFLSQAKKFNLE
eukprot:GFYU01006866.1.p1 GENE.GFYU01006866.1~~GFYU01006866.1.p1  ORF type:complete len:997 (+),score=314.78 GFYU01006866.1:191-3181(+)